MPDFGILLACLAGVCGPYLLGAAGIILLAESALLVGLVLPGTSTVLIVGSVVGLGRVDPVLAAVVMVTASSGGAQTAFLLRRRHGGSPVQTCEPRAAASSRLVGRIQKIFDRNTTIASVASHLMGGTRTVGPRLAAASSMSFRSFAVCNVIAAVLWVSVLLIVGSTVGANPDVAPYFITAGVALMVATYGVNVARRRARDRAAAVVLRGPTAGTVAAA
ncbi:MULTISPECIES: DedA family protein [unclassified Rhodococcus (in: high G+C Gram-positive bacteria)]|uniref:DedA family protein n=1 Tax=unclassified Rhodococcus (in: high G+C Gram-positive bacteria) TaxID=192944 RepID=UPI0006FDE0B1|nr:MULTISPECIES: VTT domain-containing protein [unclassified Rhodococcus (in: high G+C Gram-positive bacteria)]KQU28462.1 hypothetical protein ASG69_10675 [Rhodococcus sp. Leaf225]KQU47657.1 hypothetical protein ASH03_21385 [Rhodococcus sp. Leaf258]